MGPWGRIAIFTASVWAALAASAGANEFSGKIYTNGQWQETQPLDSAPSPAPFFAPFVSAGLRNLPSTNLAARFLERNALFLRLDHVSAKFGEELIQSGPELETHRFHKRWNGLPVLGGDALVHIKNGIVLFANADTTPLELLSTSAQLSPESAKAIAFSSYRGSALRTEEPQLKVLILGHGTQKKAHLVYEVTVLDRDQLSSDIHYISAGNGEEVATTTNVQTLMERRVLGGLGNHDDFSVISEGSIDRQWPTLYADNGCHNGTRRKAASLWVAATHWPGSAADPPPCGAQSDDERVTRSALSAWKNSGLVYDYYRAAHHRDSLDGHGQELRAVVNFGGTSFQNAAWYNDRRILLYGMSDQSRYTDFASPLDITGHELTHGITASTAGLLYVDEPGALNESYSDIFGKLIAFRHGRADDWKMGKDLYRTGGFTRDLENPEVGHLRDYKHHNEICNRANDFCGVHTNSGIPSKAATLIAQRLGLEKMGAIYYLTLTQLLRSSSDFQEARSQTEVACAMLFGTGSSDCQVVSNALTSVGM